MDTKLFVQQSYQVLCLSANLHFTQKVEKYMQNGQLLQSDQDLHRCKLTQSVKGCLLAWPSDDCKLQCGIFITMTPATKGYGGRQNLPDNLKQLFRPGAMSVPDNELIAKVMSHVCRGFQECKDHNTERIVALFLLSRQLLLCSGETLRVKTPFAETHLVSRRSVAAGPQAQSRRPGARLWGTWTTTPESGSMAC